MTNTDLTNCFDISVDDVDNKGNGNKTKVSEQLSNTTTRPY